MMEYAEKVLIPFFNQRKLSLELSESQKSMLILDVFAAHRVEEFLKKLQDANICVIFIPGGCTGELQPLDVAVNGDFKASMKSKFSEWYASQVSQQLAEGKDVDDVQVTLTTAAMKPVHAHWLVDVLNDLGTKTDRILSAWVQAGIFEAVHPIESLTEVKEEEVN